MIPGSELAPSPRNIPEGDSDVRHAPTPSPKGKGRRKHQGALGVGKMIRGRRKVRRVEVEKIMKGKKGGKEGKSGE